MLEAEVEKKHVMISDSEEWKESGGRKEEIKGKKNRTGKTTARGRGRGGGERKTGDTKCRGGETKQKKTEVRREEMSSVEKRRYKACGKEGGGGN